MRRLACGVIVSAVAAVLVPAPAAAQRPLPDGALDRVVAGSVTPSETGGQGVAPAAGTPAAATGAGLDGSGAPAGDTAAPPRDIIPEGRATPAPPDGAAVIAIGASAVGTIANRIDLGGGAQARLRAAIAVNASASDAVSLANVSDTGAGWPIVQTNTLVQTRTRGGRVDRAQTGPGRVEAFSHTLSSTHVERRVSHEAVTLRSTGHSFERHLIEGGVPSYNPLDSISIDIGFRDPPDFVLPGWGFNGIVTIGVGDLEAKFGAAATVGPTVFSPPSLVLGTLVFEGDDIIIRQGSVTLPELSFPSVTGTICFIDCASGTFSIGSVGGQTLSLPIPEFRIEGANPFKGFDLQVGGGLAAAGSGSLDFKAGSASMVASLSFSLPILENQNIGFTVPGLFDGDPVRVGVPIDLELPLIDLEFTLFEFDAPAFSGTFRDAVFCITFPASDCNQLRLTYTRDDRHVTVTETVRTETVETSSSEQVSEHRESKTTAAVDLRGAEAELLALSRGEVTVSAEHTVGMAGHAQEGLRALHAANVVSSLTGNALNVGGRSRAGLDAAMPGGTRLAQTNTFVQVYRGIGGGS